MSRAQTFDQLQANIKNLTHGQPVDTHHFCDAARTFGAVYIAELHRLGVIGGTWAAMRNQMMFTDAANPLRRASWETERCPGQDRWMLAAGPCPDCSQVHIHPKGQGFRPAHQRPTRMPYVADPDPRDDIHDRTVEA